MRRRRTMRPLPMLIALALFAAACAGAAEQAEPEQAPTGAAETPAAAAPATDEPADAAGEPTTTTAAAGECAGLPVGIMGPFTGDAATIGQEQLNWARFALVEFNEEHGTSFELVEADTQLDPAQATTAGQQFVSDEDMLVVVGPAGSQEVEAVGPIFDRAGLAFVGMSATAPSLTVDYDTFFRVVPNDDVQGPTDAQFMINELEAANVFVIDDQSSYSTSLADIVVGQLQEAGVTVARESVPQDQTDFSALVSRITDDTDVVFLPWQLAASAQLFAQQMQEQGKTATIFGSDGLFSPDEFTAAGSYVSAFAPDITGIPEQAERVETFREQYGDFGTFGPPTYAATQVALTGLTAACEAGDPTRESVLAEVAEVEISDSILGQPIAFDEEGDVEGARFYIFQISEEGDYELVE